MIYIVQMEEQLRVVGDIVTLAQATGMTETSLQNCSREKLPESVKYVFTNEEWEGYDCLARIVDGNIVLGKTAEEKNSQFFAQLRAMRNAKLYEVDKKVAQLERERRMLTDIEKEKNVTLLSAWDAYAQALCDLPAQPGAPWDGGGPETPWPEMPEL